MGKSTLCRLLAQKYCNGYFVEEETENPFLGKFYEHLQNFPGEYNPFAFKSQMYFLKKRVDNELAGQTKIWEQLDAEKENLVKWVFLVWVYLWW
jgi:deoxyadenosine/deoxycytidine kinase